MNHSLIQAINNTKQNKHRACVVAARMRGEIREHKLQGYGIRESIEITMANRDNWAGFEDLL